MNLFTRIGITTKKRAEFREKTLAIADGLPVREEIDNTYSNVVEGLLDIDPQHALKTARRTTAELCQDALAIAVQLRNEIGKFSAYMTVARSEEKTNLQKAAKLYQETLANVCQISDLDKFYPYLQIAKFCIWTP